MSARQEVSAGPQDGAAGPSAWGDACAAARLLSLDPAGLGGVWLRARTGPLRDRWLARLRSALPPSACMSRVPLHVTDERLLGGLDLAATLSTGRPVAERGLLASSDGGVLVLASAERCSLAMAARLAATLDTGEVTAERDGFGLRHPARIALVALDEGIEPAERPPAALADRMAFHIDLDTISAIETLDSPTIEPERGAARAVRVPDEVFGALCGAAQAFGIASLRAPLLAVRAASVAASAAGRTTVTREDVALAARLVLAPRATRLPAGESEPEASPPEASPPEALPQEASPPDPTSGPPPPSNDASTGRDADAPSETPPHLDDVVLAAIAAAIPPDLLARLRVGPASGGAPSRSDGSGAQQRDRRRGRPAGTIRGEPVRGARLNLVETLRAAAPWQPLRRGMGVSTASGGMRLAIRRDDLRITRFKRSRETTTVFVVDASGSAAFQRLAEAKGAVELLLADCYVRRDRVALMSFRGEGAELLLPPTRSLTRAKRSLAGLPGGGGTPLAAAIDEAAALAGTIGRAGGSAVLVFLTDGRANVGRDGRPGREAAARDAVAAAGRLRATRATVLFIDTSPRPSAPAAAVAAAMGARYIPLPVADSGTLSGVVRREIDASLAGGRPG